MTKAQLNLLRGIEIWGGCYPPNAHEHAGCSGNALNQVLASLIRNSYVTVGEANTYPLTAKGRIAINGCPHCNGDGYAGPVFVMFGPRAGWRRRPCSKCNGSGLPTATTA